MEQKKTPVLYRIIYHTVKLLSPKYELIGTENIPDGACVIVGNHCQMYGPIAAELYTPGSHYTWCVAEMMDKKKVPAYAFADFWSGKPASVRWFFRILSRLIGPLAELIFTSAHTIPVYHDVRVMRTFRETARLLADGSRIVIFPECKTRYNNILYDFQDRFVDAARLYRKNTGQELNFVPMYLAPRLKKMVFGRPIRFCAGNSAAKERERISRELKEAITGMALSLPEHTVIPYLNVPKRDYPNKIPLEVFINADEAL